jgi:predicted  nucleic acid-binding Zn-ribbon protein
MSALRQAAQQALEAMTSFESGTNGLYEGEFSAEIAALRAALENEFNPDWDRIEPLQENLREHMAEIQKLRAQRDALLEALKAAEPYLRHADVAYNVYVQARAAIKAAEENA